jgi:uncharacterized protein YqeY
VNLKDRITADMKDAMRAKDAPRLSTIRLLLAAIKQRRESIAQFEAGNRKDLADAERAEQAILEAYLPQRMSDAEVDAAVDAAVAAARAAGVAGPALIGKAMATLKPALAGRADMATVSAKVKARI